MLVWRLKQVLLKLEGLCQRHIKRLALQLLHDVGCWVVLLQLRREKPDQVRACRRVELLQVYVVEILVQKDVLVELVITEESRAPMRALSRCLLAYLSDQLQLLLLQVLLDRAVFRKQRLLRVA